MPRARLLQVAQPGAAGYDLGAIARALTFEERYALGQLAGDMPPTNNRAAQALVAAGLAVAGLPPQLSLLGEAVVEHGLAALLD